MTATTTALPRTPTPWRWTLLAIAPALLLLWAQVAVVWPFCSDDAFISLRYSERLLAGEGLTWTDGERVEGYSNLLWVLLCAGLGALGLDLVTAARLLGVLATTLGFVALARALAPRDLPSALFAATAPLLAAAAQPLLGWTCSGLEGPLSFALLAFGFAGLVRQLTEERSADGEGPWSLRTSLCLGVPFALACWTRPDGPLWVASAGAALLLRTRGTFAARFRAVLALGALPMLAVAAQLAFRLAYHGDVVPNTAHVKADVDDTAWANGFAYVGKALALHLPLLVAVGAALLAGVAVRGGRERFALRLVLLLPVLAWLCYLATVGGDHFPGRRLLHGAIAPLALLATVGLRAFANTRSAAFGLAGLLAAIAGWQALSVRNDPQTHELRGEVWEWRGQRLGETLRAAFGAERPLLAVDAAGAVPFYSRLPSLDLLGLCDRTIATTPVPAWQATMRPEMPRPPGHLKGNGRYVMDRAPDLLLLANPPCLPLPVFASACEFEDDPRFLAGYRCVMLEVADVQLPHQPAHETQRTPLWVRLDGRVGVQRDGDTVTIPAWLFGALQLDGPIVRKHQPATNDAAVEAAAMARLGAVSTWYSATPAIVVPDTSGALQLELRSDAAVTLALPLAAGRWRAECEPPEAGVRLAGGDGDASANAAPIVVAADGVVTLQLQRTQPTPTRVQRVRLVRSR